MLSPSGTNPLVMLRISKHLVAAVDRSEELSWGIRKFIEIWNGWLCSAADPKRDQNQFFQVNYRADRFHITILISSN